MLNRQYQQWMFKSTKYKISIFVCILSYYTPLFTSIYIYIYITLVTIKGESIYVNVEEFPVGLKLHSKQDQSRFMLLCSLSDPAIILQERYDHPPYPPRMVWPSYPPSYGLNCSIIDLLQRWLWHEVTDKGWYALKHRNQTKPMIIEFKVIAFL